MSYDKQTWETGEVITASKLNHMEDGIADSGSGSGGGVMVTHLVSGNPPHLDKTVGELWDYSTSGIILLETETVDIVVTRYPLTEIILEPTEADGYYFTIDFGGNNEYVAGGAATVDELRAMYPSVML